MLPTKFFDPPSGGASNSSQQPQLPQRQGAPPPLGMTGVMCKIGSLDIPHRGTIQYRIFRPRQLISPEKPPLVVLHGGPLIPCNYLLPLAYVIVDRSIIFYDQLGCGQSTKLVGHPLTVLTKKEASDEGENKMPSTVLDVDAMVHDLACLIKHWKLSQIHLLGHSFGGILLFEYLKYCKNHPKTKSTCRSATLASVPTSTQLVEEEVQRLCLVLAANNSDNNDDDDEDDEGIPAGTLPKKVPKRFRETHECRMTPTPFPLMDSYSRVGPMKLRGLQSIGNYTATLSSTSSSSSLSSPTLSSPTTQGEAEEEAIPPAPVKLQVPVLVLRGQHDFVTDVCVKDWDNLFQGCHYMTLAGCAHYGMLENEVMYGSVLSSFLGDCDDNITNNHDTT